MWVDGTPPMSAATAEIRSSAKYQSWSTGSVGQRERCGREVEEAVGVGGVESALVGRSVGQLQQLRPEQGPGADELLQPRLRLRVEEAPVGGDQHRGEHPERVASPARRRRPDGRRWRPPVPSSSTRPAGRRSRPGTSRSRRTPARPGPARAASPPGSRRAAPRSPGRCCRAARRRRRGRRRSRRSPPGRPRPACCTRAPRSRTGSARRRANSARRSASARVRRVWVSQGGGHEGCCLSEVSVGLR